MKTKLTLLTLLITITTVAQNGINYKALIKDDLGNLVASQDIDIRFTLQTLVGPNFIPSYIEIHHTTTDVNGVAIVNIGEGDEIIAGDFPDGFWFPNITLNIEIDIEQDGTFVDFGESSFSKVPMAIHADNVFSGDYNDLTNQPATPTGLEKVTDSIDSATNLPIYGWRMIGVNPERRGNIGENSVDLSHSLFISSTHGPTGENSLTTGESTKASGENSTAMGLQSTASGNRSVAMGYVTKAIGSNSFAMGSFSNASGNTSIAIGNSSKASGLVATALGTGNEARGNYSTAIGRNTSARSFSETVIGSHNTDYIPIDSLAWAETDRLFVVGNGINGSFKRDALTVLKNGTITAPSFDISEITDDKALITKEYFDSNYEVSSGLEYIDETDDSTDNGGWRLIGVDAANYGPIGLNAIDFSSQSSSMDPKGATGSYSTSFGSGTEASGSRSFSAGFSSISTGDYSIAIGFGSTASNTSTIAMGNQAQSSGFASVSMGNNTVSSADYALSIGNDTWASGISSTALGENTRAIASNSTAMGYNTFAVVNSGLTIGRYNINDFDGLFVVGNGPNDSNRNNAFVIKENGDAKFDGEVHTTFTGNANMIPIAYGSFDGDDGTNPNDILSGTGNFTVTREVDFTYTISVNGETLSASNSSASVVVSTDFFRTANVTYSGGDMKVHIFSSTFNKVPAPFQFIIYKN
ncbi:hypothetical protein RM697_00375 [Ichthyenterobacterium sp. W332]|uniref:Trimeric autotransporter adhesin YadA-like head domain-containing protein n=1 Tax=Microcosmobacter mediterraneus TaxID=3075607 RepID=A0ABU2YFW6_9FLAO|nr:hypothetical protein [Ichthyenterobacterium sp. W332]MDT0557078.1 hypothetical protein [Ichthyenterobacterium sp. W332]